jgi:WD40 repeat protein
MSAENVKRRCAWGFLLVTVSLSFGRFPKSLEPMHTAASQHSLPSIDLALTKSTTNVLQEATRVTKKATLLGHTGRIEIIVFSPDGHVVATGSKDNTVRLWDSVTGQLKAKLTGHKGSVYDANVGFSPDGRQVATFGVKDKTVKLWDVPTGQLSFTLIGHQKSIYAVAFSPDGRTIATGGHDEAVKLWDSATGQLKETLSHKNIRQLFVAVPLFSPDGKTLLVAGGGSRALTLWDPATGKLRAVLSGHVGLVLNAVFSPDGQLVATSSHDYEGTVSLESSVKLWDAGTGKLKGKLTGHKDTIIDLAFSPNGQMLATASRDLTTKLWDVSTGDLLRTLEGPEGRFLRLAFSPDGRMLATVSGAEHHVAKLWDVTTGRERAAIPVTGYKTDLLLGHQYDVEDVKFSPDGKILMTWSSKMVALVNTQSGELIAMLQSAHSPAVFSPDGRTLATAGQANTVLLWDVSIR